MWVLDLIKLVYGSIKDGKFWYLVAAAVICGIGYLVWILSSNIIETLLVCVVLFLVVQMFMLPKIIIRIIGDTHSRSENYRDKISPIIRYLLTRAIVEMEADRAFVTEGHNGSTSLTNVSFLYMDITYLETSVEHDWINFDYRNLSTSMFPCFHHIAENGYFIGDIEDLRKIDNKISRIIKSNGTEYLVAISLNDSHNRFIGTVVVTYLKRPDICETEIEHKANELANKLERILSVKLSDRELNAMM